ncbi:hypothetical protein DSO57_1039807 [Entomophthora muscae]|uniref:Uncharacterized protein n=1 Tax=Entomophthora muscae TaxID=34485 RepID=A0ACC2RJS0_9FUNG|nr:hypothetical protein DSO57_1039807 [Entomophthora muscae]
MVNAFGKHPDPDKCNAITKWPTPTNANQVSSFLGFLGYYHQFIEDFSELAAPLFNLTHKKKPFKWGPPEDDAFKALKAIITSDAVLAYPDFTCKFYIFSDACTNAVGAVLCQEINNVFRPIEFMSKKFIPAKYNYAIYNKEVLAVIKALKKFCYYVLGHPLIIHVDNWAVKFITNASLPCRCCMCWLLELMEYYFEIVHIPGKLNSVADGLSCQFCLLVEKLTYETPLTQFKDMARLCTSLVTEADLCKFFVYSTKYTVIGNTLFKKTDNGLWVIPPKEDRESIFMEAHNSAGHFGQDATLARLKETYWWPGMYTDTYNHTRSCMNCQQFSKKIVHTKPVEPIVVDKIYELWGIDFIGPLPPSKSGKTYILVATEYLSCWPVAQTCSNNSAMTAASFIYNSIVTQFGPPATLLSDQGSHFRNCMVADLTNKVNTVHKFSTVYNPCCNGLTERFNHKLVECLEKTTKFQPSTWEAMLPSVLWKYCTKVHNTIKMTPFEAMFGT